jgi:hyaluronoglucosaminidase
MTSSGDAFNVKKSFTITILGEESERVTAWFQKRGIVCAQNGNILIKLTADKSRDMTYISENRQVTDEKYCLECEVLNGIAEIRVSYSGLRGLWYAFNTIVKQWESGSLIVGKIVDYPLFKVRGYIEGFYGKPWTTSERADMLQLMSAHGMHTYYYAPKADPYHRSKWSELYPETELRDLKALIQKAQDGFVNFCFCIAPGLSMKYSSDEDYALLLNKIKQIYALGVRTFGLLLDDIPKTCIIPRILRCFRRKQSTRTRI